MDDGQGPYATLFEPVQIGPKLAPNRFYQVPHCNGMGHLRPRAHAAMRGIKAEGGWGVVSTEETEIHPTSDIAPSVEQRIWDDRDIPALRLMTEAVHTHGSLAAVELAHNGQHAANLLTRTPPLAPSHMVVDSLHPVQARAMDAADIRAFRRWHRAAAQRAADAGFDIVYVYAGHNMTLPFHFMLPRYNGRSDEYGGSLANRVRLTRELLEDTKDAVGDRCAVAFRFAVDELMGPEGLQADGEAAEIVAMLADLPDLWDLHLSGWANDSVTARFSPDEGYQEPYTAFVKRLTDKPVVGVGRFTSPDAMVSQIRRGVLDLIGAARPSIADPFLPAKIREGRIEEIRECIGCNICVAGDNQCVPMRCTQNPTMGEEWRRGWHPERIAAAASDDPVLVIGAGPAGLECALQLARRGYPVTLAEASTDLGGRARAEAALPGLGSWIRVADYRTYALKRMQNVEIYLDSTLTADQVLEFSFAHVFVATGSVWRRDGVGRRARRPIPGLDGAFTPDDILAGRLPEGRVLIYDDDHAYLGGAIAEALKGAGRDVVLVTPAAEVSAWCVNTLEQPRIQRRLLEVGVDIVTARGLVAVESGQATLDCVYTGRTVQMVCDSVVTVTERLPNDGLAQALREDPNRRAAAGIRTVKTVGDALAPGLIAAAVYSGHAAARAFQADPAAVEAELFRREMPALD